MRFNMGMPSDAPAPTVFQVMKLYGNRFGFAFALSKRCYVKPSVAIVRWHVFIAWLWFAGGVYLYP